MHAGELFPGFRVLGCSPFRVTRNFDLSIDEDEADDLLKTIQKELRRRERGSAVRLEIAHDTPVEVVVFLRQALRLETRRRLPVRRPAAPRRPGAARRRATSCASSATSRFRRRSCRRCRSTTTSSASSPSATSCCITRTSRSRTWSSSSREAADDPNVLAIKQTLYRTSADSPDRRRADPRRRERQAGDGARRAEGPLRRGAQHQWARTLEKTRACTSSTASSASRPTARSRWSCGARATGIRRYVHLSTGNYNPTTARVYTDLSLLHGARRFGDDAGALFNLLTGYSSPPSWKRFASRRIGLQDRIIALIEREAALGLARRGSSPR